ncbi:MAG TPA: protein kinase [Kofleriaceae bacterium]|nr:protein kinase [Kofleriaceae bacterium]
MSQHTHPAFQVRRTVVLDEDPDGMAAPADGLAPGACVASYEIVRELGRGGMGEVYLARDHELDRFVAVKLLAEQGIENLDRCLTEARATARCQHENIIVIHQVGEDHGRPYMVLEYLEGETLAEWLSRRRRVAVAQDPPAAIQRRENSQTTEDQHAAIAILRPVVRALVYAHERGIVHRDLKPANIMLTHTGGLKVLDFGIAKLRAIGARDGSLPGSAEPPVVPPSMEMLAQSMVVGTLPYMAPEQLAGGRIDHRADLWAVGIMLWELVIGVHPLVSLTPDELLHIAELDRPMPAVGEVAGMLGEIIERCLHKRVDERIGSAQQLLAALDAAAARLAPDRAQTSDGRRPEEAPARRAAGPWRRLSRLALGLAVPGLVVALVVEARSRASMAPAPEPPASSAPVEAPVEVVLADFVDQSGEPGMANALATAFRIGVEQSQHVRVMSVDKVRATLSLMRRPPTSHIDRALGLELCQRTGAGALILASITGIGARYVLAAEVITAENGASLAVESVEAGSRDRLLDALETLSLALRRRLGESREALKRDRRTLDKVTTSDIEALRLFTLGVTKKDQMASEDAVELLEQAVARDPDFAMAHAKLGVLYYYTFNQRARGRQHWQQALAHRDRLSDREALYVEGSAQWEGSPDKMLAVWHRYTALYPDDSIGFDNLGFVYWWYHNRFREAIDGFEKAVSRRPDNIRTLHDLGSVLIGAGRYDEAIAAFERAYAANPRLGRVGRADAYLAAGRHTEALAALQERQAVGTRNGQVDALERELTRLAIFADLDNARAAEAAAGHAIELARASGHPNDLSRALFARAALLDLRGDVPSLRAVLTELTRVLRSELSVSDDQQLMGRPVPQLALVGAVYARNRMISEAKQIRATLKPQLDAHDIVLWSAYVALLDGELSLALGDHAAAILTLRRGLGDADLFQLHGTLVRALRAGGFADEADSELRWLVAHRGQALVEWVDAFFGRELNMVDWARARNLVTPPGGARAAHGDAAPASSADN